MCTCPSILSWAYACVLHYTVLYFDLANHQHDRHQARCAVSRGRARPTPGPPLALFDDNSACGPDGLSSHGLVFRLCPSCRRSVRRTDCPRSGVGGGKKPKISLTLTCFCLRQKSDKHSAVEFDSPFAVSTHDRREFQPNLSDGFFSFVSTLSRQRYRHRRCHCGWGSEPRASPPLSMVITRRIDSFRSLPSHHHHHIDRFQTGSRLSATRALTRIYIRSLLMPKWSDITVPQWDRNGSTTSTSGSTRVRVKPPLKL